MFKEPEQLFDTLDEINERPELFSAYTAKILWDDDHISKKMLAFHLDEASEPASRPHEFLGRSADWIVDRFSLNVRLDGVFAVRMFKVYRRFSMNPWICDLAEVAIEWRKVSQRLLAGRHPGKRSVFCRRAFGDRSLATVLLALSDRRYRSVTA